MKALRASLLFPVTSKPITDGVLITDQGRIVDLGPASELLRRWPDAETTDLGDIALLPGLVDAHTHLDLLFFEGDGQNRYLPHLFSAWEYRRRLTPAQRRDALADGIRQLVKNGTTCVGDSGNFSGLAGAAAASPIRMVLFPEIFTNAGDAAHEEFDSLLAQVDEISQAGPERIRAGLAPFATYTLSRSVLKILKEHAAPGGLPIKIRAAETFPEMQFFFESAGELATELFPKLGWEELPPPHRKTPIEYLESIGFLSAKPILVGCIHLSEKDLESIARSGAKAVVTPRANLHFKKGLPPIRKLLQAGVPVALGTDGLAGRHTHSLWDEMRSLAGQGDERDRATAAELVRMATLGGAIALGLGEEIGSLEPGKRADLVALRIPTRIPKEPEAWLVENGSDQRLEAVFVDGERVDARGD